MSKVQLAGNASGTGIFQIASPNSNTDRTLTLPDATGTVQLSGNPISGTTGTFSGLIYANGGGVQFPATQVPSSDANCLDDYEEGTFTPTYGGSGSNPTVSYDSTNTWGIYTKIGNVVNFAIEVRTDAFTGGSGDLLINSLPFTPRSGRPQICSAFLYNITFNSSAQYITSISSTSLTILGALSAAPSAVLQVSAILNTSPVLMRITGSYFI